MRQLSAAGPLPHPAGTTQKTPVFRSNSETRPIGRKGHFQTQMSRFYKYFTKHMGNSRMKLCF